MQSSITAVVIVSLVMLVESHPICSGQSSVTTNEPSCYTNLTASASFLNEWLSIHQDSEGIDKLRNHKGSTVWNLLRNTLKVIVN